MSDNKPRPGSQSERAITVLIFAIIVGILISILFASQAQTAALLLSIFGVALAIAGASLLSGSLLGFLFGIPRVLQSNPVEGSNPPGENRKEGGKISIDYQANTNLEQISDWLTKILVGVGLTQLITVPDALQKFAEFAAPGLGNFPNSGIFAVSQLIFFLVCGFLISFLWTRRYLAGEFRQADLDALGEGITQLGGMVAQLEGQVGEVKKQLEFDANGLSTVQRQLNPSPGVKPITQDELDAVIKPVSTAVREQIFNQIDHILGECAKGENSAENLEKTIPVYKALIASDSDNSHDEYHGNLGMALQLKRHPSPLEAESELTKAIEMRGGGIESGWTGWEFYRAESRIMKDADYKQRKQSNDAVKEAILTDLKTVDGDPVVGAFMPGSKLITEWLKVNGILPAEFASLSGDKKPIT
jgi:hypothetical protein